VYKKFQTMLMQDGVSLIRLSIFQALKSLVITEITIKPIIVKLKNTPNTANANQKLGTLTLDEAEAFLIDNNSIICQQTRKIKVRIKNSWI